MRSLSVQAPEDHCAATEPGIDVTDSLSALVHTLDGAAADLFAAAPFPGEPRTGREIDGYVDDAVAALRSLRTDADDLHRTLAISRQHRSRPEPGIR